jgi:hypothetical protein
MAQDAARTARSDAEKAALGLLKSKASLVGAAAQARHEREQAAELLATTTSAYAEAYQAARDGGWTVEQLTELGLEEPVGRRRRARANGHAEPTPTSDPVSAPTSS